jgi:hypothetical protein
VDLCKPLLLGFERHLAPERESVRHVRKKVKPLCGGGGGSGGGGGGGGSAGGGGSRSAGGGGGGGQDGGSGVGKPLRQRQQEAAMARAPAATPAAAAKAWAEAGAEVATAEGACVKCGVDDDDGVLCDGCDAAGAFTPRFLSLT